MYFLYDLIRRTLAGKRKSNEFQSFPFEEFPLGISAKTSTFAISMAKYVFQDEKTSNKFCAGIETDSEHSSVYCLLRKR